MVVKLIRKFADSIDGVDLSNHRAGDVIRVSKQDGNLLLAEGWAVPAVSPAHSEKKGCSTFLPQTEAADTSVAS
jgi:hypothetical protein